MRPFLAVLLALGAGCSGFVPPTPGDFRELRLAPASGHPDATRVRVHLSVDSSWLAGEFDGVVLVHEGASPVARVQMFGDLGPKIFDLLARPDRIVGFFPQTREGIDCLLPAEAAPHPLLFLGVNLLEEFADLGEDRVVGIRPGPEGWWLNLKPLVAGMRIEALHARDGRTIERRFRWMYGLSWSERWEGPGRCTIRAAGLVLRVQVLGTEPLDSRPGRAFELQVPEDIRIVEGTRK